MSTPKEIATAAIDKIKRLLNGEKFEDVPAGPDTTTAAAFKDYTTDSGAVVKIDKLEAGGMVTAEDGTPVNVGFTLSDGTTVAVDETGMITAVTTPVAAAAEPTVPPVPPAPAAFSEQDRATMEQRFTAQIEAVETARKADIQKFTEIVTGLVSVMEQFAAEPSADPIQPPTDKAPALNKKERAMEILNLAKANAAAKGL